MSLPNSLDADRSRRLEDFSGGLGYLFDDLELLEAAFRHRSWCGENGAVASNERLEFLGDAVLQLVVTERLFVGSPELPEGVLAQRRSALVNTRVLADAARRVGLGALVRLGRGESATGGVDKDSILADATEAVIGAVYLDGGYESAVDIVTTLLSSDLERVESGKDPGDPKSRLQELAARSLDGVPDYDVSGIGPDHQREFTAIVRIDGVEWGVGEGRTKKEAEQASAAAALLRLADEGKLTHGHG